MDDKNDYEESATTRGDQSPIDLKKSAPSNEEFTSTSNSNRLSSFWAVVTKRIDLEEEGINPITNRVTTAFEFYSCFSLWFSMNLTIAAFSAGTLGSLLYGLSFPASAAVIVLFNIFSCGIPSFIATFGPQLGMRTMAIARFSFGFWGAAVPALLNLITFIGFCAVNAIVGGQTLAAINPGSISVSVGIVIIALGSLVISWAGYRVLHLFERFAWMPILLSFIILTGVSRGQLPTALDFVSTPATAGAVLSFATIIVGFTLSWAGCSADFNTYMSAKVSSVKVACFTFLGLYLPCVLIQLLGAAFAAAALSPDSIWGDAFTNDSIGGLLGVALIAPLGGFGKFLLVVLALGIITNCAPTTYAFSISLQIFIPYLARFPRSLYPVIATAIYLPLAIVGASNFSAALNNFLGLLGYWIALFCSIILVEHFFFRKSFAAYEIENWNDKNRLPIGFAASFAFCVGVGVVVASMDQVYWRGPIAVAIAGPDAAFGGDIGIWLSIGIVSPVYGLARYFERRHYGR